MSNHEYHLNFPHMPLQPASVKAHTWAERNEPRKEKVQELVRKINACLWHDISVDKFLRTLNRTIPDNTFYLSTEIGEALRLFEENGWQRIRGFGDEYWTLVPKD